MYDSVPASMREKTHAEMPKGVRLMPSGKYLANVRVGGKVEYGPKRRDTLAEAEADAAQLFAEQKAAQAKKREDRDVARANERAEHAEKLDANYATYGGNLELDGLSRDILKLALADSHLGAANNVEYGLVDSSVYARANDMGFDLMRDYELDPGVPTFSIQLKASRSLQSDRGKWDNPHVEFNKVNNYDHPGMLVVMLYIPPSVEAPVTRDYLKKITFWYDYGHKLTTQMHRKYHSLKGGRTAASLPKSGLQLRDVIEREFRNQEKNNGLVPYGARARLFLDPDGSHAKGQAAVDAFREQALNPLGALLLPPENGREGGASDVRIHFPGGEPRTAQVKHVRTHRGAGFNANLMRAAGYYRDATGETKRLFKPYKVGENDLYVFVRLDDDDKLAEYWCATEADMIGGEDDVRLISDNEGNCGVLVTCVHPHLADRARLGDTHPNNPNRDDGAVRTRQWIQSLGPILPPDAARALADRKLADKRALHASATAAAAAATAAATAARVEDVAAEAGPSNVTNITYNAPVIQISANAAGKRALGSLDGWVKRLKE
jgi:hypothetical protein